MQMQQLNVNF